MDRLILLSPSPADREEILAYKAEFLAAGDSMDGTAGLRDAASFDAWYQAVLDNASEETVREGLVPASTFLAVDKNSGRLVGFLEIRHRLNDHLLRLGGHIGYSVRPTERRKGYATEMLALALEKCRELGLARVLITCDRQNTASSRTMLKNGAVLENEVPDGDRITQRYWITL